MFRYLVNTKPGFPINITWCKRKIDESKPHNRYSLKIKRLTRFGVMLTLIKDEQPLFEHLSTLSLGCGVLPMDDGYTFESDRSMGETFCMGNVICIDHIVLHEDGTIQYQFPATIATIEFYNAWPWILLRSGVLIHVQTRLQVECPYDHFPVRFMALSPCRACLYILCKVLLKPFLYKDVCRKLSVLVGHGIAVDALNEVYRFIKC